MRAHPRLVAAAFVALSAMAACGSAAPTDQRAALSAARDAPSPTAQASSRPPLTLPPVTPVRQNLDLTHPIHIATSCDHDGETLAQLVGHPQRGAAIASVLAIGSALWNTPTGARPSQADLDVPRTTPLGIYTPIKLRLQTVLHAYPGVIADTVLTTYLLGGKVGDDWLQNACGPTPAPHAGSTAVVLFAGEFPMPAADGAPVHRPTIDQVDVIQGGQAFTWNGPQPVPTPL